jgi:plasmid stabilization system protein ParE
MKIIGSPLSITRINEIADYISSNSLQAARKWVDDIFQKVEREKKVNQSARRNAEKNGNNIGNDIKKRVLYFQNNLYIIKYYFQSLSFQIGAADPA